MFFLTVLNKGEHNINLIPRNSAFIEEIKVKELSKMQDVKLVIEEQAEDGDRRPWYTFVLLDLPLKEAAIDASVFKRVIDSDDLKIIIDNNIQTQVKTKIETIKWRRWLWVGALAPVAWAIKELKSKIEHKEYRDKKTLKLDLNKAMHYLEIIADRMPVLHAIELDFGEIPKWIPNIDHPK